MIEINGELDPAPELVNQDPYGKGWLVLVRLTDPDAVNDLLTPEGYTELVRAERGES